MMPARRDQNWLPSIFNEIFGNEWMERSNRTAPAVNIIENEDDYCVEVAAPGMTREDFKININEDNELVISMGNVQSGNRAKRPARNRSSATSRRSPASRTGTAGTSSGRRIVRSKTHSRASRVPTCAASFRTASSSRASSCPTTWTRRRSAPAWRTAC